MPRELFVDSNIEIVFINKISFLECVNHIFKIWDKCNF